jgi:hypothetical protein
VELAAGDAVASTSVVKIADAIASDQGGIRSRLLAEQIPPFKTRLVQVSPQMRHRQ